MEIFDKEGKRILFEENFTEFNIVQESSISEIIGNYNLLLS